MSDLEAIGDPNHVCGEACAPYVPLAGRDLEDLEESDHIDALYAELNMAREHAALLILALARANSGLSFPARAAAVLLDLDEEEIHHELGPDQPHSATDVVNYAIRTQREDGYVGKALKALFRIDLASLDESEG
ncbi:hypothetical protein OG301_26605 [Streptomyces platensis]|uniref:hypothetical protein n=1 Tax=Streptomyces platensis TaxID=58346 RepID=UPI002ED61FBD|nr:hypothetical protein OG301_26605 [Streptomyces platensis]